MSGDTTHIIFRLQIYGTFDNYYVGYTVSSTCILEVHYTLLIFIV